MLKCNPAIECMIILKSRRKSVKKINSSQNSSFSYEDQNDYFNLLWLILSIFSRWSIAIFGLLP